MAEVYRDALVGALLCIGVLGARSSDQVGAALRFDPAVGSRVHSLARSELTMVSVKGSRMAADTTTATARRFESATRFVDGADNGRYSIYLLYDSVRTRVREGRSLWRDVPPTRRDLAASRAVLDESMRVLSAEFVDAPHLSASHAELLRALAGTAYVVIPAGEYEVGGAVAVEVRLPVRVFMGLAERFGVRPEEEFLFRSRLSLDSVLHRASDTLSYVTVIGRLDEHHAEHAKENPERPVVSGTLAATMVWSSEWDAFVTGAMRILVRFNGRDEADRMKLSWVRFDVTTQFQVRL